MVKTLPFADIEVLTPGFGAMGISFGLGNNLTLEQAEPVLLKAIELGCTFWDTAVGLRSEYQHLIRTSNRRDRSSTKPESMRSSWGISSGNTTFVTRSSVGLKWSRFSLRDSTDERFSVASKCGFNVMNGGDGSVTNSASHIKSYIEGTIERLGFAPDLYYLHRIDPSEMIHLSFECLPC